MESGKKGAAVIDRTSIVKRMALGAVIGLVLIGIFIFPVRHPDPDWGKLWMIRPLLVTPIIAALGSLAFYSVHFISNQNRWKRAIVIILSAIAFVIALWMGIILGLAGTLWN